VTTVFAQEKRSWQAQGGALAADGYLQMQVGKFIAEPSVSQNYGECEIVP
jgi:hypothetical protein